MKLDKYEKALYYEIFHNKEYGIIDEKIKESKIIFDIWSHIWFFSLYCLEINPNLIIHSFEASKDNYDKSIVILNNYKNNIISNNVFVDYKIGLKDIYINQEKSMQTSFYNNQFLCKSDKKEIVKSIDLIKYIQNINLDYTNAIDIIKIDIEWYEFDLLLNIDEIFFIYTKTLVFEYHILFPDFDFNFELLNNKLKKYYKNIETLKSKYSDKIWIIVCYN